MQDIYEDTDYVILLLSTDWFSSWASSIGLWRGIGGRSVEEVRTIARSISNSILGTTRSYYEVDLSSDRRRASYYTFLSKVESLMRAPEIESLKKLIDQIQGAGLLSNDQRWAMKSLFLSEAVSGFNGDLDGLFDKEFRDRITGKIRELDSLSTSVIFQSSWDISLAGRFDGMPSVLVDYVDSALVPCLFFDFIASEMSRMKWSRMRIGLVCDWISREISSFGVSINGSQIAMALEEAS